MMMETTRHKQILILCLLSLWVLTLPTFGSAAESRTYPKTTGVLIALYAEGIATWQHYKAYEQQAHDESFPALAKLFAAMAASQSVATHRLGILIVEIGGNRPGCLVTQTAVAETQINLRRAIEREFKETDVTFPRALGQIAKEGYDKAIRALETIIAAQRLHRKKLEAIYPYTSNFFGAFVSKITTRDPRYYICTQTGTVILDRLPANCPVRGGQPIAYIELLQFKSPTMVEHCRRIDPLAKAG